MSGDLFWFKGEWFSELGHLQRELYFFCSFVVPIVGVDVGKQWLSIWYIACTQGRLSSELLFSNSREYSVFNWMSTFIHIQNCGNNFTIEISSGDRTMVVSWCRLECSAAMLRQASEMSLSMLTVMLVLLMWLLRLILATAANFRFDFDLQYFFIHPN